MKLTKKNNQYIVSKPQLSLANEMLLESGGSLGIEMKLLDMRTMTNQQRKFIFKLCQEVNDYSGLEKELFRAQAMAQNVRQNEVAKASLTEYNMTDANKLIDIIIEYFIDNEIPLPKHILEENEFKLNQIHIYSMCLKRKCAICSRYADLHHVDAIGMGRDRKTVSHIGLRMLPLCRVHHTEAHTIGDRQFLEKHHLTPIEIDEKLEWFIKKGTLKTWKE